MRYSSPPATRPLSSLRLAALVVLLGLSSTPAMAVPANVLIIVDTSASMNEPLASEAQSSGESKLDRAKAITAQLAAVARTRGHRVGLFRFRQQSTVVSVGETEAVVVSEHDNQCDEMVDLLVPPSGSAHESVTRWVNGTKAAGDPELEAVGDSPLYGAVRVVLRFVRGMRKLEPGRQCVNTVIVVIGDGADTCAAGGELQTALAELRAQGVQEDIQAFMLSADPSSDASKLIAGLGHDTEQDAFGFDQADDLVAVIDTLEGRLAPAGCVASGVAEQTFQGGSGGIGTTDGGEIIEPEVTVTTDGGGCTASAAPSSVRPAAGGSLALVLMFVGLLAFRGRRRVAALLALLAIGFFPGCKDDTHHSVDVVGPDVVEPNPELNLPDPEDELGDALAHTDALYEAAKAAAALLEPHLIPEQAFAAIEGDPQAGCLALVETVAYEPYDAAQRSPAGCLGTLRCNGIDQARLLQACLIHHGVDATLHQCQTTAADADALKAAATAPPAGVSIEPAARLVSEAFAAALDSVDARDGMVELTTKSAALFRRDLDLTVGQDTDGILQHLTLDPAALTQGINADMGVWLRKHYVVRVGETTLDPVLGSESTISCDDESFDWEDAAEKVVVELLVQHAALYNAAGGKLFAPSVALRAEWPVAAHWGELARITIREAGTEPPAAGIPAPATSGCFQPQLTVGDLVVDGEPFALTEQDEPDCGAEPVTISGENPTLVRVILRTHLPMNGKNSRVLDRILIDRWGYASDETSAIASGGQYTLDAMRTLLPMQAELRVGGGRPTMARHFWELQQAKIARHEYHRWAMHAVWDLVQDEPAPPQPSAPIHSSTMAWLTERVPDLVGDMRTVSVRPWRTMTLRRRGYGVIDDNPLSKELGFREQAIFDIIDIPEAVWGPASDASAAEHEARLRANVALGALVTEAERMAVTAHTGNFLVVNAGDMFRHGGGEWASWDSDEAHAAADFPMAVREAAQQRIKAGEHLIVSPQEVEALDGSTYMGWWRVDTETGFALGEIRYDGTLYGGGAASAIGNFAHCMAFQAIQALTCWAQVVPNTSCCAIQVIASLLGSQGPAGGEVTAGLQGLGALPPPTPDESETWRALRDFLLDLGNAFAEHLGDIGSQWDEAVGTAVGVIQAGAEVWDAAQDVQKPPPCTTYVVENETVVGGECPPKPE